MLNSIEIQNYRNLKHLSVEKLGRVNLIIGRNNTGKTSLLEAVYLFRNSFEVESISKIVASRGENRLLESTITSSENTIKTVENLFWNRRKDKSQQILIQSNGEYLNLSINKVENPKEIILFNYQEKYVIEVHRNSYNSPQYIVLEGSIDDLRLSSTLGSYPIAFRKVNFIRSTISSTNIDSSNHLAAYLDDISLGDNYEDLISSLKIVDNNIEKISYLTDIHTNSRFPVVRLKNGGRIHLQSMGDGINRILAIILTMVCCENGYFLIDEFENGLHYSVQEKLWEIIFHLAERLNIQVFATTHSNDTIRAFENIVNQNETVPLNGLLIKLENIDDTIEATTFEPGELKIITDNLIEVRR